MFGMGIAEMIVFALIAIVLLSVPIAILIGVFALLRKGSTPENKQTTLRDRVANLEDEVSRLKSGRT